jgi:hypothetical protein
MAERSSLSSWILFLLILLSVIAYWAYRYNQDTALPEKIELDTPDSPAADHNDPDYGASQPE